MIYLDNAATSFPKPEAVYQALDAFARTRLANPGRAGHRMALGRRADPGRRPARPQPVLPAARRPSAGSSRSTAPTRLNMAIKGTVKPGDHVITTDLEHNSISRPLRGLEKAGVITLTRLASDRRLPRPRRDPAGPHPDDRAGRPDARQQRARDRAADRGRSPRSSARPGPCSWSTPPSRPASCRSTSRPRRSTCSPSPATRRSTARPAPGPSTSARAPSPRAWREGGTGGDSSSETQPDGAPVLPRRRHAQRPGRRRPGRGGRLGRRAGPGRTSAATRSACSSAWSTGSRTADGWSVAGRWDPATTSGRSR